MIANMTIQAQLILMLCAGADELSATAEEMNGQTQTLQVLVDQFKLTGRAAPRARQHNH